eukprot:222187-Chlamydomonas_euryale.AAC.1
MQMLCHGHGHGRPWMERTCKRSQRTLRSSWTWLLTAMPRASASDTRQQQAILPYQELWRPYCVGLPPLLNHVSYRTPFWYVPAVPCSTDMSDCFLSGGRTSPITRAHSCPEG